MPFQFPSTGGRGGGGFRFPFPPKRSSGTARQRPMFGGGGRGAGGGMSGALKMRLLIAAAVALFAVVKYYGKPGDLNEVTGETERVAMTEEAEEIQLGLQAAPQMVNQHGGPSRDMAGQHKVQAIGEQLLQALDRRLASQGRNNPYRDAFRFTLLSDDRTVNAFALPGGPVFITKALFDRLGSDAEVAGVIGHEIGHVLARHGNKRMAQQGLFQGLAGAVGVLGGDANSARMAQMVSSVLSMRYGRDHELESDQWGVRLLLMANYNPNAMIGVMKVLEESTGGGGGTPEFFKTHPNPENRIENIKKFIDEEKGKLADDDGVTFRQ